MRGNFCDLNKTAADAPLAPPGACERRPPIPSETSTLAFALEQNGRLGWLHAWLAGVSLVMLAGCGNAGPPLIEVTGKVTIDGTPASEGGVVFRDVNNAMVQLIGAVEPDGSYSMMYNRRPGVPVGKYRVTVLVTETAKGPDGNPTGLPRTLSNSKFSDPNRTPFEIEVREGAPPEAYDLAVTR